jgi:hypothetical protein
MHLTTRIAGVATVIALAASPAAAPADPVSDGSGDDGPQVVATAPPAPASSAKA